MGNQPFENLKPGDIIYDEDGKWQVLINNPEKQTLIVTQLEPVEAERPYSTFINATIAEPQPVRVVAYDPSSGV